jgi:hypothetical protein
MQRFPDNFLFGMLTAILCLSISYFLLYGIRAVVVSYYGNPFLFAEPKIQMIAVVINIVVFRFVLVTFKKEKTGRGILFATVVLIFIYFFLYSRYHFRMSTVREHFEIEGVRL